VSTDPPTIEIQPNGPYVVKGGPPLRRKRPIVSEHGEPLTWSSDDPEPQAAVYALCRCGGSANKPFCDGTHARTGFDGTETAPTDSYDQRAKEFEGTGIVVGDDRGICEHAGFCGNRLTNVWKMVGDTTDSIVRAQVIAMVERCPSGALTFDVDGRRVEPDLPVEIGLVDDGPLYVTGGIAVHRADGQPCETRNRVTLCRCGGSKNKPLCDGTHKAIGFTTL
jgi:CDGSH-type Zn-finger protein